VVNTEVAAQDYSYDISVTNLTAGQPISPVATIAHGRTYQLFSLGESASLGLEQMAEGGNNDQLLTEAEEVGVIATLSGDAPVGPLSQSQFSIDLDGATLAQEGIEDWYLTIAGMLVNTNDAFISVRSDSLANLAVGESLSMTGISYDSGTEANSELAGTIPGPADGGSGFEAERDDIANQVTAHAGVISADDGLTNSVLTAVHRWDNPTVRVAITRTQ
jgi:hypothetical protein